MARKVVSASAGWREVLVRLPPRVVQQLDALAGLANATGACPSRWHRADVVSFALQLLARRAKGNVDTFRRLLRGQASLLEDDQGDGQGDAGDHAGDQGDAGEVGRSGNNGEKL